jgi:integrase
MSPAFSCYALSWRNIATLAHTTQDVVRSPLTPTPVSYRNFLKRYLTPSMKKLGMKEPGKAAHAFRRFRSSILAKSGIEEDIRKFWLGHENNDITAQYAEQIREDNTWRQALAGKVGLGFQIPAFVPKPIVRTVRKNRQAVDVAVAV